MVQLVEMLIQEGGEHRKHPRLVEGLHRPDQRLQVALAHHFEPGPIREPLAIPAADVVDPQDVVALGFVQGPQELPLELGGIHRKELIAPLEGATHGLLHDGVDLAPGPVLLRTEDQGEGEPLHPSVPGETGELGPEALQIAQPDLQEGPDPGGVFQLGPLQVEPPPPPGPGPGQESLQGIRISVLAHQPIVREDDLFQRHLARGVSQGAAQGAGLAVARHLGEGGPTEGQLQGVVVGLGLESVEAHGLLRVCHRKGRRPRLQAAPELA